MELCPDGKSVWVATSDSDLRRWVSHSFPQMFSLRQLYKLWNKYFHLTGILCGNVFAAPGKIFRYYFSISIFNLLNFTKHDKKYNIKYKIQLNTKKYQRYGMTCDRKFGKETQQEAIKAYKVLGTLK